MILLGFILVGAAFAADQNLSQTFTNAHHGFSISFPAGWRAMAAEKLETANKAAEAQHPDWKRPAVHYGYEVTNSAGLAFSPYMMIRVAETSGAPDPKAVQDDLEKGEELPQGVEQDQPAFDKDLNAFVQKFRISMPGVPRVEGTTAYLLTARGVLKMFFYAPPADDGGAVVPVRQIISTVRIYDGSPLAQPAPASRMGLFIALLAIALVVIVLARAKPAKSS